MIAVEKMAALPDRWSKLRPHREQRRLWRSKSRFNVVPAGRRSGKTELAKRKGVLKAINFCDAPSGRFIFAAPTHTQAKDIYWSDVKSLVPRWALMTPSSPDRSISESELTISLWNGARIQVMGLDKPERAEGSPVDGIVLDEYGNMKAGVWTQHLRPALSTVDRPPGWCWFIGVPEGRNHYYELWLDATSGEFDDWSGFTWISADILDPKEIEAAKRELDELTYLQEYEASFVNFSGRAYHSFDDASKERGLADNYDLTGDLEICLDFNVSPGVAVVCQELDYPGLHPQAAATVTAAIGEVWIPRHSNTPAVCRKLIADWGNHRGRVNVFGDATGGSQGTAKTEGSDWELVQQVLGAHFGDALSIEVSRSNPPEKDRVNALNSRVKSMDGTRRLFVDPGKCPRLVKDLEGTVLLEGGSGEIDKKHDKTLTHMTDALGYYVHRRFPITGGRIYRHDLG